MKNLVFVGFNPDGAKSKFTTIKRLVRETNCAVVTMQETKCARNNVLNMTDFIIYDKVRGKVIFVRVVYCRRINLEMAVKAPGVVACWGDKRIKKIDILIV